MPLFFVCKQAERNEFNSNKTTTEIQPPAMSSAVEDNRKDVLNVALIKAAANGKITVVKKLLNEGASVDCEDQTGEMNYRTPLMAAAGNGYVAVVRFLVEKGADVNACGYGSPIVDAAGSGHLSIVKYLLTRGADVNQKIPVDSGWNALMSAASGGHYNVVEHLLRRGAKVNDVSQAAHTALGIALTGRRYRIAKLLIRKGADVNYQEGGTGETLLMNAVRANDQDAVQLLLDFGVDITLKNKHNTTAMDYARANTFTEIAEMLGKACRKSMQ